MKMNLYYPKIEALNVLDDEISDMIEKFHYSQSARSLKTKNAFKLFDHKGYLRGAAVYGQPCSRKVNEYYGGKVLELRRFITHNNTRKNTESYFLGQTLRWLKSNTDYKTVISYADPNYGHMGIIYKATNFEFCGETKDSNPIAVVYLNETYSQRELYQKYKGQYTPKAKFLQTVKNNGKAKIIKLQKKLVYKYNL